MKIIDLKELTLKDVKKEFTTLTINLSLRKEMELNIREFDISFNKQIEEQLENLDLEKENENIIIVLKTDLGKDDRDLMIDFILNRFIMYLVDTSLDLDALDREKRLGVPPELKGLNLQTIAMMDLVNYWKSTPYINIGVATKSGKNILYIA